MIRKILFVGTLYLITMNQCGCGTLEQIFHPRVQRSSPTHSTGTYQAAGGVSAAAINRSLQRFAGDTKDVLGSRAG